MKFALRSIWQPWAFSSNQLRGALLIALRYLAYLFFCLYSTSSSAITYLDNPPQPLDRHLHPAFNAVGQLTSKTLVKNEAGETGNSQGTAFLVSPCYIVTNYHVVFGSPSWLNDDNGPVAVPQTKLERDGISDAHPMSFSVGFGENHKDFRYTVDASLVTWGHVDGTMRNDWALLKLSSCLGMMADIGWMETDLAFASTDLVGKQVALVSFPGNFSGSEISYGWAFHYNRAADRIECSASSSHGSSGGAVVIETPDGIRVIGMHRGTHPDPDHPRDYTNPTFDGCQAGHRIWNNFLNISDVIGDSGVPGDDKLVIELINADVAAFGRPNPNAHNLERKLPAPAHVAAKLGGLTCP